MPPRAILPFALIVTLSQAALAAAPAAVAAREGGMGLGSALIAAQVVAVGGVTLGAMIVAGLTGTGLMRVGLVAGALAHYAAFIALGMQPMGALAWIVVALGLAGIASGMLLTIAFVAVARADARDRPAGVVVLLLASFAAHALAPLLAGAAGLGLTLLAGAVVAVAVLVARGVTAGIAQGRPGTGVDRAAIATGLLVSIGVITVLAAADPSRVTAILLAGSLGRQGLEGLDLLRLGMAVAGALLVIGPAVAWSMGHVGRPVRAAASGLGIAGVAMSGTLALTSVPGPTGGGVGPALTVDAASLLGLGIAGWWLMRTREDRRIALWGTALLVAGSAIGLVSRGELAVGSPDPGRMLAAGIVAAGGAAAFVALRHALASARATELVGAAAAGVAAFAFGSMLGTMLGSSARAGWTGAMSDAALPAGLAVIGAAILAVVAAWLLPRRGPAIDERDAVMELSRAGADQARGVAAPDDLSRQARR